MPSYQSQPKQFLICSLESLNYSSRTNKFEWNPFSSFGSVSLVLELIDYTSYMRNLLTWAKFFFLLHMYTFRCIENEHDFCQKKWTKL